MLQAELTGADLSHFAVENLVGVMRVTVGPADRVTVRAVVHAENAALADGVRVERIESGGTPTLRVRYPYDKVGTFRYREPGSDSDWGFGSFSQSSEYDYDERVVHVNPRRGSALWADLEVRVPPGALHAAFRNVAGRIEAEGLEGNLQFGVESADLRLRKLSGDLELSGSSGDIRASDIHGSWKSEFASGDCRIEGFEGRTFDFHSASGDLVARSIRAQTVRIDTASGDATLSSADIEDFEADASSGDIRVAEEGTRLKTFVVTTSSGDVSLGLPPAAAFDAEADQSSGDMYVGFRDGESVERRDTLVGYRKGSGGAKIRVTTSSGDFSLNPR